MGPGDGVGGGDIDTAVIGGDKCRFRRQGVDDDRVGEADAAAFVGAADRDAVVGGEIIADYAIVKVAGVGFIELISKAPVAVAVASLLVKGRPLLMLWAVLTAVVPGSVPGAKRTSIVSTCGPGFQRIDKVESDRIGACIIIDSLHRKPARWR
jgi:hypothetical protein